MVTTRIGGRLQYRPRLANPPAPLPPAAALACLDILYGKRSWEHVAPEILGYDEEVLASPPK